MSDQTPLIRQDSARRRFEAFVGDEVAGYISYRQRDGVLDLRHTVVDEAFEGRGIGSALVRGTLDAVRDQGLRVTPTCPFISAWLGKHPDYADLVA